MIFVLGNNTFFSVHPIKLGELLEKTEVLNMTLVKVICGNWRLLSVQLLNFVFRRSEWNIVVKREQLLNIESVKL